MATARPDCPILDQLAQGGPGPCWPCAKADQIRLKQAQGADFHKTCLEPLAGTTVFETEAVSASA